MAAGSFLNNFTIMVAVADSISPPGFNIGPKLALGSIAACKMMVEGSAYVPS